MGLSYMEEYHRWLESPALSEKEWEELNAISGDEKEIENRFFAPLEFGTAGLRGTMKTGLHHMNIHVIRHVTQAFADVIRAEGQEAMDKGIAIDYDCRNNSSDFAREAACVMAANGINVSIFDALRPTPELSFAVRHYGMMAGLNITASHNPKEYNGYKVYWSDGAQLPPQKAAAIAKRMEETDLFTSYQTCDFDQAVADGRISLMGSETDEVFLENVLKSSIDKSVLKDVADDFKVVYSPFHGCGYKLVPEVLRRLGLKQLYPVREQMVIDGNFPTVYSPNPEDPNAFALAVKLAEQVDADLIIGTDPDADRIGTFARNSEGVYAPISGNQLGILLMDYIIRARIATGTMPENPGIVSSIVTTGMARAVAEANNIHFEETFTGFKFMAERISEWEASDNPYHYIMAYEESYGYMIGEYVRDKDAVTAAMLTTEMAAYYCKQNMTLFDAMDALYEKYGWFVEHTINIVMPGLDGLEKMRALMAELRANLPETIAGVQVIRIRDYLDGSIYVTGLGKVDHTQMSGSNVLYFEMADGSTFIIRPSGTEPKIKVYILVRGSSREACMEKIKIFTDYAETFKK